jgi:hypothetical protein
VGATPGGGARWGAHAILDAGGSDAKRCSGYRGQRLRAANGAAAEIEMSPLMGSPMERLQWRRGTMRLRRPQSEPLRARAAQLQALLGL